MTKFRDGKETSVARELGGCAGGRGLALIGWYKASHLRKELFSSGYPGGHMNPHI